MVGHILFTPVVVEGAAGDVIGMGLAPVAVRPDRQREGIGSQLVKRGLEMLRERACPFVVVVGHPEYYPRFGLSPPRRVVSRASGRVCPTWRSWSWCWMRTP